jgi:Flp pilus assembly protein TadD
MQQNRFEMSEQMLRRAAELDPLHVNALLNYGDVLIRSGRPAEALTVLLEAERLAPNEAKIQNNLGGAYWALNRLAEAMARLKRAGELAPDDPTYRDNIEKLKRKMGMN